ncbi:MAG: agmatinase family protein [Planctomycetes bacterium]|nr:agmatinase family protein [Planctomycetota bacterium]
MSSFDPNAAAAEGSGIFGLPGGVDESSLVIVPVPFAATVSYGRGTERGPAAVLEASHQVDLYDLQTGRPYERGIHMLDVPEEILALDREGRKAAESGDHAKVDEISTTVDGWVADQVRALRAAGKIVGVLGGDHSVPLGAIREVARDREIGILHVDAHADLRVAYEGFRYSHASIMHNVLAEVPGVTAIAQVGIRDFCEQELDSIRASEGRVRTWFDHEWLSRRAEGEGLRAICDEVVSGLPRDVWVSFDIDGLDPTLCPGTGTPVPGGLDFHTACVLLERLAEEHRIIGFDLCEVAPADGTEWNENVGARILYKLCGFTLLTN